MALLGKISINENMIKVDDLADALHICIWTLVTDSDNISR